MGEVLIDLVALDGQSVGEATRFHRAPGGAPANVAVALARLGIDVAFISKVSTDAFGRSLRSVLEADGVDLRGLRDAPGALTTLAFVGADPVYGRSFVFYRDRTADTLLQPREIDRELIAHARVFNFGSLSLSAEPTRSAIELAVRVAHQAGCLVTFDPNVRLELWPSAAAARAAIDDVLALAHIVKVSSDELDFLTGTSDPDSACTALRRRGPRMAVVTLGGEGSYFQTDSLSGYVPAIPVTCVDTLGAGDAFMAGLLARLATVGETDLPASIRFANAVGAITTTRYGAIPALPTSAQVEALLASAAPPA